MASGKAIISSDNFKMRRGKESGAPYAWLMAVLMSLSCLVGTQPAAAGSSVGAGIEYLSWREYFDSGKRILEESGPRAYLVLESDKWVRGVLYGFIGRLYSGNVAYDGQYQNGDPATAITDYRGVNTELTFTWPVVRNEGADTFWGLRFGIGVDAWRRHIRGDSGYTEEYVTTYARAGASFDNPSGVSIFAGAKIPITTREKVIDYWLLVNSTKLYTDDVSLSPQGELSLFIQAKYYLKPRWLVSVAYDSYRFQQSDYEFLTHNGTPVLDDSGFMQAVRQPDSHQDTIGINLSYEF